MYRRVAKEILSTGDEDPGSPNGRGRTAPLQQLRLMLQKVVLGLSGDEGARAEFERLQWIAHLTASKALAAEQGAAQPRRKIAVSMLRHIREVPADKAFYEAGMCCKAAGDLDMAFVFLNRYLDITEVREISRAEIAREIWRDAISARGLAISARDLAGGRGARALIDLARQLGLRVDGDPVRLPAAGEAVPLRRRAREGARHRRAHTA